MHALNLTRQQRTGLRERIRNLDAEMSELSSRANLSDAEAERMRNLENESEALGLFIQGIDGNDLFAYLTDEGLLLGGSSGINVAGAIRLAKQLGPGKTIVTILCDSGSRYQSKLFNPEFLRSKDLPAPDWL